MTDTTARHTPTPLRFSGPKDDRSATFRDAYSDVRVLEVQPGNGPNEDAVYICFRAINNDGAWGAVVAANYTPAQLDALIAELEKARS